MLQTLWLPILKFDKLVLWLFLPAKDTGRVHHSELQGFDKLVLWEVFSCSNFWYPRFDKLVPKVRQIGTQGSTNWYFEKSAPARIITGPNGIFKDRVDIVDIVNIVSVKASPLSNAGGMLLQYSHKRKAARSRKPFFYGRLPVQGKIVLSGTAGSGDW